MTLNWTNWTRSGCGRPRLMIDEVRLLFALCDGETAVAGVWQSEATLVENLGKFTGAESSFRILSTTATLAEGGLVAIRTRARFSRVPWRYRITARGRAFLRREWEAGFWT